MKKLLMILLCLLMLVGCSSGGGTETAEPTATTEPTAAAEKELVVATLTDVQSMDNVPATDGTSFIALQNITAGLTSVTATEAIEPEVADSWIYQLTVLYTHSI